MLKRAGRQRGIEAEVERLHAALRVPKMRQLPLVETAMGRQTLALLGKFETVCTAADDLAEASVELFEQHPDAAVITSFPGLGALSGARVLAEIGDDRSRFADAKALKAHAGSAPVTRASGKSHAVMVRRVKNQRLAAVGYVWAFASLTASPGARAHYNRPRKAGDRHSSAQRNLYNRQCHEVRPVAALSSAFARWAHGAESPGRRRADQDLSRSEDPVVEPACHLHIDTHHDRAEGAFAPGHLGGLTQFLPFELVDDVLEQTGTVQQRVRALPSRVGIYFVLALGLFPGLGYQRVWDKLVAGLAGLDVHAPSETALRHLRRRLGPKPLEMLFHVLAVPLARPSTPGVCYRHWRVDGVGELAGGLWAGGFVGVVRVVLFL